MAPEAPKAVVVVGSGRFGRHYPHVLAGICRDRIPDLPIIDTLVITATGRHRARQRAADLKTAVGDAITTIIGAPVASRDQLEALVAYHRPALTCIAARDRRTGDAIHARYSQAALPASPVLCEKPFSPATGDGASVIALDELAARYPPGRFGLELPLAVVARAMATHPILKPRMDNASRITLHWQRPDPSPVPLIPDLALHPWSLLPDNAVIRLRKVTASDAVAEIALDLIRPGTAATVECRIRLETGGMRRTMTLDGLCLGFHFASGVMQVLDIDADGIPGRAPPLLTVANPLRQHIEAMLRGRPVVGFERARAAQVFLEAVSCAAASP